MMKLLLTTVIIFLLYYPTIAQDTPKVSFTTSTVNPFDKHFFEVNTQIQYLVLRYHNDDIHQLIIYRKHPSLAISIESLNLRFGGDKYILAKKYDGLVLPAPPKLQIHNIISLPDFKAKKGEYWIEAM